MKKIINVTVVQLHKDEITLSADGSVILYPGDRFAATDNSGRTYRYQYLGRYTYEHLYLTETVASEHVDFHLFNEDECHFIDVELAWFGERKINILEEEK